MPATPTQTVEVIEIRYAVEPPTLEQVTDLVDGAEVLGPTATVFLLQAARRSHYNRCHTEHRPIDKVAQELGGLNIARVHKTLRRLDRFGAINLMDGPIVEITRWGR